MAYRLFLKDSKGVQRSDIWADLCFENYAKVPEYQTQKEQSLMNQIVLASSNNGDVCADFFAGSGSFGVAAKNLNRDVILCDINPEAIKLSQRRLNECNNLFNR